jgi:23S rRNA (uracil1939-C5)-methyltransferase
MKGFIQTIAFGGSGIMRNEGEVIFVPFTAPEDVITCKITKKKKNFSEGEIVSIEEPGPKRTKPLCPHFTVCGGCQLQQITYEGQLEAKRQWIADALQRIGKVENVLVPAVIPSKNPWQYRRHITLHLQPREKGFKVGYFSTDNKSLVEPTECPIFTHRDDPIFQQIRVIADQLESFPRNEGRVTILKQNDRPPILLFHFKFLPNNAPKIIQDLWVAQNNGAGAILKAPNYRKSFGVMETNVDIDGLKIKLSPEAFIQNHPEQSLNLYRTLCDTISGTKVLDLYSGIGISSLLLARKGFAVTGVESNGSAVRIAKQNGAENGQTKVNFLEADVKTVLKGLIHEFQPDSLVVNPPREGMETAVVETISKEGPKEIVYISCMPSTLARDLRILCDAGYRIKMVQAFDMFPQTAHVETLVHLERN